MIKNKILLIDDDKFLLDALAQFLSMEKFDVKVLDQSDLIQSTISTFNPDLIILDIDLGDADGRLICDELRINEATAHIPIILLTGLSYEEIAAIDCMADAIIGKPFESSMLMLSVKELTR